jgi:SsrA-binding protein
MAEWFNKKAKFNYSFLEEHTCGIVLESSEAKSIFESRFAFNDCYCYFKGDELFLKNFHISTPIHFQKGQEDLWQPLRERKLLMQKYELRRLKAKMLKGLTLIPVQVFIKEKRYIKIKIALAKGKKSWDKRETIKKRDDERKINQL